ncbi:hypothetical protein KQX54_019724 [Cotesia glomerata]|uniref:Uncharacterized protein n=1 Tax=Cotesia glomerata TaxID=32391 RepID=A0AAV7J0C9_COTGL|nr:hypothetical protein KQX54_019724 [Cotesia glomerata]
MEARARVPLIIPRHYVYLGYLSLAAAIGKWVTPDEQVHLVMLLVRPQTFILGAFHPQGYTLRSDGDKDKEDIRRRIVSAHDAGGRQKLLRTVRPGTVRKTEKSKLHFLDSILKTQKGKKFSGEPGRGVVTQYFKSLIIPFISVIGAESGFRSGGGGTGLSMRIKKTRVNGESLSLSRRGVQVPVLKVPGYEIKKLRINATRKLAIFSSV